MLKITNRLLNNGNNMFGSVVLYSKFGLQTRFVYNRSNIFNNYRFNFSNLARNPNDVSVSTNGSLYDLTARPLDDFDPSMLPNKYKPGLKSCRIFDNPNIVHVVTGEGGETLTDKLYRYLDIGGFFSMLNSRKIHLLRTPPEGRNSIMCMTELERKQSLITSAVCSLMMFYLIVCYIQHKKHIFDRHPSPDFPVYENTNNKTRDFTWHGGLPFQYPKGRCKECRWLELECKKKCYDRLLESGHKFILQNPMQVPRRELLPSPYPPMN